MKFEADLPENITEETIKTWLETIEESLQVRLPNDYRKHMLKYNGGTTIGENVIFDSDQSGVSVGEDIIPTSFHYLNNGEGSLEKEVQRGGTNYINKGITICYTYSGILMMSLSQDEFGSIYHMHSYGEPIKIANSWTEFVSYLIDAPEE